MPQTMPLNWLNLFLLFSFIFMLIIIKMYFNNKLNPVMKKFIMKKKNNWKW
uniref:ATP synthase F0 subunit 8 n=1 Tax=Aiolocaria hexaspilota TaxID=419962 RepID=A0A4P8GC87_9CUCU|nr:ATP synthase F0 subunit 8 [Aiolocaria hexaspilota]QCO91585.1 ATP synthase F0 subunit 8 [Aiolocaria hexaspilota]UXW88368.1 ATP synthase F0 subunit 8 [Aiolocaria hexaspilota]